MDLTHWMLLGATVVASAILGGLIATTFMFLTRRLQKDEAIDAMIFLAQREAHRELRERFEQMRQRPGR